jgi:hypothetical protein
MSSTAALGAFVSNFDFLDFEFVSDFEFRISDFEFNFGFRICARRANPTRENSQRSYVVIRFVRVDLMDLSNLVS